MILPSALLLSQCAASDGPSSQTVTAMPASSQHRMQVSFRPATLDPRSSAAALLIVDGSDKRLKTAAVQGSGSAIAAHGIIGIPRQPSVIKGLPARGEKNLRRLTSEEQNSRNPSEPQAVLLPPLVALDIKLPMLPMLAIGDWPCCLADAERKKAWISFKQADRPKPCPMHDAR